MKIPAYAILLVIVGGVTVGGVFASHDATNPFDGRVQVLDDVSQPENAQLLVRSTTPNTDVIIEGKGKSGQQATFSVIGSNAPSVFQILASGNGSPTVFLSDVDDNTNGKPQYKIRLNNDQGALVVTYKSDTQSETNRIKITPDGKIGIGTATPSELLDVNGNIHLSQLNPKITANGDICIGNCP